MTNMKLKIRIGSIQIGADPIPKQIESSQGHVLGNECRRSISTSLCNKSEMAKSHNLVSPSDTLKVKFTSAGSNKRRLPVVEDGQKEKRRKMDRTVTQQCASLLKKLMIHPAGWVFNHPVDAVKLQLPDYHHVISQPMDLGTVKSKLNKNEYSSIDEFAAHVRLTFSNAMTYNPPSNNVHLMAKELDDLFVFEWNALAAKWIGGCQIKQPKQNISGIVKCTDNSGKNGSKIPPSNLKMESQRLVSAVEKQELKEQLLVIAKGKVPSHLQGFLKKLGIKSLDLERAERIEKVIDVLGDEDLWELRKITTSSWVVQTAKVGPTNEPDHVNQQSRLKIIHKGTDNGIQSASGFAVVFPPPNSVNSECVSCRSMNCKCNKQNDKAQASSDISSERSRDYSDVSLRDCRTELHLDSQLSKSDLRSKGARIALNEEPTNSCPPFSTTNTAKAFRDGARIALNEEPTNTCPPFSTTNTAKASRDGARIALNEEPTNSCPPFSTTNTAKASRDGARIALNEEPTNSCPPLSTTNTAKASRDGERRALNEERTISCPPVSTTDAPKASAEGFTPQVDVQLSPQKALRAALLKSRFADTIFKAKQKALLDQGDKVDPVKLQQEKERLERQQQEEKVKIEAQIKASQEAARLKAEVERKMQLEREREAARLAVRQMVKTVEISNDHKILKDLELLSGCSLSDQLSCVSCESSPEVASGEKGHFGRALEKLGLFIKDDYLEDEDDDSAIITEHGDGAEEGEISP